MVAAAAAWVVPPLLETAAVETEAQLSMAAPALKSNDSSCRLSKIQVESERMHGAMFLGCPFFTLQTYELNKLKRLRVGPIIRCDARTDPAMRQKPIRSGIHKMSN